MFNASALISVWNRNTGSGKKIHEFLRTQSTKDFIEVLMQDIHQTQSADNQVRDNNPRLDNQVVKVFGIIDKTNAKTDSKARRIPGEVWFHPYLFMDFAMWLNPRFKLQVIKFVYDQLIEFRHNAGDYYRGLTSAVTVYDGVDFSRIAKGLNYIVFGKHQPNLRQNATIQELKSLSALQEKLAFAVNMG